jgi:hypothetical protein
VPTVPQGLAWTRRFRGNRWPPIHGPALPSRRGAHRAHRASHVGARPDRGPMVLIGDRGNSHRELHPGVRKSHRCDCRRRWSGLLCQPPVCHRTRITRPTRGPGHPVRRPRDFIRRVRIPSEREQVALDDPSTVKGHGCRVPTEPLWHSESLSGQVPIRVVCNSQRTPRPSDFNI